METIIIISALSIGKKEIQSVIFVLVVIWIFLIVVVYIVLLYNLHIETHTPSENVYFYFYILSKLWFNAFSEKKTQKKMAQ